MAIASSDSVTVSIAAEMIGIFNRISGVRFVLKSTSRGSTEDLPGTKSTSSNVRPNFKFFVLIIFFYIYNSFFENDFTQKQRYRLYFHQQLKYASHVSLRKFLLIPNLPSDA